MVIETITAFAAVKITWELLEIMHLVHVAYITGKTSYHGGNAAKNAIEKYFIERGDQKNPARKIKREVKTRYDFQDADNIIQAIQEINKEAAEYLTTLNNSVKDLREAQTHFSEFNTALTELVKALSSNDGDQFSTNLLSLKTNFTLFKGTLTQFSLTAAPPPRQILYIADSLSGTRRIEQCNAHLIQIKECIGLLKDTKQNIADQFRQGFEAIDRLLPGTSSDVSDESFENLKQSIQQCMNSPREHMLRTMHAFLPNNPTLATSCTDIIEVFALFAVFKQSHKTEQTSLLEDNPTWVPLLTTGDEQIKAGQRIFLQAMNGGNHDSDEKLLIAQIFLRKSIPKQEVKQANIDEQAYEMARLLRIWQIKKCDELIRFLSTLKQGDQLPNLNLNPPPNPDSEEEKKEKNRKGLLEWLKTNKVKQNPVELFKEILVLPCCFSQGGIDDKFKNLSIVQLDPIIKRHWGSYYGAIWEKNDTLIQLPKSFKTNVSLMYRWKQDGQSQKTNIISSVMQKLAKTIILDLEQLKTEFEKNKYFYKTEQKKSKAKRDNAPIAEKNQEHEAGAARVKEAVIDADIINSPSSCLFPYLYQAETINKEWQVPTKDDLLHVIYIGVDPKRVSHYFYPDQKDDSRIQAWDYACRTCQVDRLYLLSNLFSATGRPALKDASEPGTSKQDTSEEDASKQDNSKSLVPIKNGFLIQAFVKGSTKIPSIANSLALNGMKPKAKEEIDATFQKLENCHAAALLRVHPELRKQLPLMKKLGYFLESLFKSGQKIGKEQLEIIQELMGDLSAALLAENADDLENALVNLDKNYEGKYKKAKYANNSDLSITLEKLLEIFMPAARQRLNNLKKTTLDSKPAEEQTDKKKGNELKKEDAVQAREQEEQAREQEEQKKTETTLTEKDEEIKRLRTELTAPQPTVIEKSIQKRELETNSIHEKLEPAETKAQINEQSFTGFSRSRSCPTLFSAPTTSRASTAAEDFNLTRYTKHAA